MRQFVEDQVRQLVLGQMHERVQHGIVEPAERAVGGDPTDEHIESLLA